jgi:hypothetical protein
MSVTTFKEVAVKLLPCTSVLVRGNHGIGKSGIAKQVRLVLKAMHGEKLGEFPVIDRRAGQLTEGDVVGLPSTDGETTRFNPPDWVKKACVQPCFLFLDELNRGTVEVMQAFFQLALDHELNGWKLHPLTRVFSAINDGASYTVTDIDPALLDRFFVIDLAPTTAEFIAFARNTDPEQGGNFPGVVADFIESNDRWLSPSKTADVGSVEPTPRAWEAVHRSLEAAGVLDNPSDELFFHVARGFVGNEAAIALRDFAKSIDNRITGEEILASYSDKGSPVRAKVKRMTQERQNGAVEKLADVVTKTCDSLTKEQGKNIAAFMKDLPDELKISLWSKVTAQGINKLELCQTLHEHCAEIVLGVFGVPMGEAGVGVTPNIPGIFKGDKAESKAKSK